MQQILIPATTLNGYVIETHPYKARAYLAANTQMTKNSTTQIILDTESYDLNGNFATGAYTVPVTGYYAVNGVVSVVGDGTNSPTTLFADIYVDSGAGAVSKARGSRHNNLSTNANLNSAANVSDILYLTAGNVVSLWAYVGTATTNNPSAVGGSNLTFMSIHLISL